MTRELIRYWVNKKRNNSLAALSSSVALCPLWLERRSIMTRGQFRAPLWPGRTLLLLSPQSNGISTRFVLLFPSNIVSSFSDLFKWIGGSDSDQTDFPTAPFRPTSISPAFYDVGWKAALFEASHCNIALHTFLKMQFLSP